MAEQTWVDLVKAALWRLVRVLLGQTAGWLLAEAAKLPAGYAVIAGGMVNAMFKLLRDKYPTWTWIPL